MDKHTVKSQVYLCEGEEVVLDDVKVKIIPTEDGERREVTYIARRVSLEGSKYVPGPAFHADKLQAIGRVIPVAEARASAALPSTVACLPDNPVPQ